MVAEVGLLDMKGLADEKVLIGRCCCIIAKLFGGKVPPKLEKPDIVESRFGIPICGAPSDIMLCRDTMAGIIGCWP